MKNIFSTIVLLVLCAEGMFASNGSVYSRYGIGELVLSSSVRSLSLGSTGAALQAEGYIDQDNPASLGSVARTLFNGSYQYRNFKATDGTSSSMLNAGNYLAGAMAFPVYKPYGIVFAMGFAPVSSVGYYFKLADSFAGAPYNQTFTGSGGLSAIKVSLTYSPMTDLSLGATMDYMFGTINDEHTLTYDNATYYASDNTHSTAMNGITFHLGALESGLDKLLGMSKTKHLSLGVSVFTGGTLSSSEKLVMNRSTTDTAIALSDNTVKLPFGIGVGLAYQNNRMLYTGDVHMQQWSDLTMLGTHPAEIQNSMRAGFGVEWMPGKEFIETYWQQVAVRLGGYAQQTNVNVDGTSINEYFATAGLGLPLGNDARLNIGLEYGIRGTTASSLVKNNILRLTLSISAGDIWFIQPEVE